MVPRPPIELYEGVHRHINTSTLAPPSSYHRLTNPYRHHQTDLPTPLDSLPNHSFASPRSLSSRPEEIHQHTPDVHQPTSDIQKMQLSAILLILWTAVVTSQHIENMPQCGRDCVKLAVTGVGCEMGSIQCACSKKEEVVRLLLPCVRDTCSRSDQESKSYALSIPDPYSI
jgi:hypothetical protein